MKNIQKYIVILFSQSSIRQNQFFLQLEEKTIQMFADKKNLTFSYVQNLNKCFFHESNYMAHKDEFKDKKRFDENCRIEICEFNLTI